jgi:ArsR family transcriptional regulator, arsenate/arsenite/antimonite-responsive transcriptional repressor / arsenate reductase (thioredoxin)
MRTQLLEAPPPVLTMLAHEVRWHLLRALALSDYRVQELVELVGRPLNLVSYHLKQLRIHQLVSERRSSADARDVYYHLDLGRLQTLYIASGGALHPAITASTTRYETSVQDGELPTARILFLCTHNSARSQMAEGIARSLGKGHIEALSAGTVPSTVHPDAIRAMADIGIDISHETSKHMDQFVGQSFDYVITVCDRIRESCPVFPNDPENIHWSFPDPSAIDDPHERSQQFQTIARELTARIGYLLTFIERNQFHQ